MGKRLNWDRSNRERRQRQYPAGAISIEAGAQSHEMACSEKMRRGMRRRLLKEGFARFRERHPEMVKEA